MKDSVILLLVIVAGTFGFLWHNKAKSVSALEQELVALTEQRDKLQGTVADYSTKIEAAEAEEAEATIEESSEALAPELENLKTERDNLAAEWEKREDKLEAPERLHDERRPMR